MQTSNGDSLVRRARAGDPSSREALARAWLGRVYAVALAITGRAVEAEDLTQEVFFRAFRSLASLKDPSRFGPWILQIARNAARDLYRRPARPVSLEAPDALVAAWPEREDAGDGVRAWRDLPEDQRLITWLKIVDGMTFRAIADLLGSSRSAVDRAYRKALARLREEVIRCRR